MKYPRILFLSSILVLPLIAAAQTPDKLNVTKYEFGGIDTSRTSHRYIFHEFRADLYDTGDFLDPYATTHYFSFDRENEVEKARMLAAVEGKYIYTAEDWFRYSVTDPDDGRLDNFERSEATFRLSPDNFREYVLVAPYGSDESWFASSNPDEVLGISDEPEKPELGPDQVRFSSLYFGQYPWIYDYSTGNWFYLSGEIWSFNYGDNHWYKVVQ